MIISSSMWGVAIRKEIGVNYPMRTPPLIRVAFLTALILSRLSWAEGSAGPSPTPAISPSPTPTPVSWLPGETKELKDERMAWWTKAKYGMFIHWGLYCIPADGEWHMRNKKVPYSEYSKLAKEFNPVKFDADSWMNLVHESGMNYVVITTKHHDGFAMFHSKASPYNVVDATPFKRDVVKELSEAAPRHGITFCTYYSFLADWGHPGGQAGCPHWDPSFQDGDKRAYVTNVAIAQVRELLSNYGKIGVLWFDTDGSRDITPTEDAAVIDVLKTQPQLIVDPRVPGVRGDFDTQEQHMPLLRPKSDYWELCGTVNGSWGYTGAKAKPLEKLLPYMITAWGMGGNVLMNVGPTREGIIPEDSAERLRQIGDWLKVNGESIYGSKAGPFVWLPWGTATRKDDTVYLQVFHWPVDGQLKVPLSNKPLKTWLLADPEKKPLETEKVGDRILVHLPDKAPDPVASVIALEVQGVPASTYESICLNKPVTATCVQDSAKGINDDDASTRWRNTNGTASFTIDLGKPETFSTLRIGLSYSDVKSGLLEVRDSGVWKTILKDMTLKRDENIVTFPAATGDAVRFSFSGEANPPQISDFELYPSL